MSRGVEGTCRSCEARKCIRVTGVWGRDGGPGGGFFERRLVAEFVVAGWSLQRGFPRVGAGVVHGGLR